MPRRTRCWIGLRTADRRVADQSGHDLGPRANAALDRASEIDSGNPRVLLLQGVSAFNTPAMFGGGTNKAEQFLRRSLERFAVNLPISRGRTGAIRCARVAGTGAAGEGRPHRARAEMIKHARWRLIGLVALRADARSRCEEMMRMNPIIDLSDRAPGASRVVDRLRVGRDPLVQAITLYSQEGLRFTLRDRQRRSELFDHGAPRLGIVPSQRALAAVASSTARARRGVSRGGSCWDHDLVHARTGGDATLGRSDFWNIVFADTWMFQLLGTVFTYAGPRLGSGWSCRPSTASTRAASARLRLEAPRRRRNRRDQRQLRPHFLLNSLNSILALIDDDPAEARRMIGRLSSLLHTVFDGLDEPFVPLDRELEMVRDYLEVERIRFGDRLQFTVEADDGGRSAGAAAAAAAARRERRASTASSRMQRREVARAGNRPRVGVC